MPLLQRLSAWSVRHRKAAVLGWFGFVLAAVLAAVVVPGPDASNTDPGEAGVVQTVLRQQNTLEPIR